MILLGRVSALPEPMTVFLEPVLRRMYLQFGLPENHENVPLTEIEAQALVVILKGTRTSSKYVVWRATSGGESGFAGGLRVGWEIRVNDPKSTTLTFDYRILVGQQGAYLGMTQCAALENLLRLGAELLGKPAASPISWAASHDRCCPDKILVEKLLEEVKPESTDALAALFRTFSEPLMTLLVARFAEHARSRDKESSPQACPECGGDVVKLHKPSCSRFDD